MCGGKINFKEILHHAFGQIIQKVIKSFPNNIGELIIGFDSQNPHLGARFSFKAELNTAVFPYLTSGKDSGAKH